MPGAVKFELHFQGLRHEPVERVLTNLVTSLKPHIPTPMGGGDGEDLMAWLSGKFI